MHLIGDGKNWQLLEDLVFVVGSSGDRMIVPAGFVTDFASVPAWLQGFISPLGPNLLPAVVHDYLYWNQSCTRAEADSIFLLAMEEMGVSDAARLAMYLGARHFGQQAWDEHHHSRNLGLARIVPVGFRRSRVRESWSDYRGAM